MVGEILHYVIPAGIDEKHLPKGVQTYKGPTGFDAPALVLSSNDDGTVNVEVHHDPNRDGKGVEILRNVKLATDWAPGTVHHIDTVTDPTWGGGN